MTKYVAISLVAILLAACNSSKNPHSSSGQEEDLSAKELLQGIWLDDETESPLMRIEGDTIYYADSQSAPITFKIIRDTLYTYGNDTTYYKIDKQGEHIFWFHSIADNMIRLHKSEDPNDSLSFVGQEMIIPTYTEVTKRDSIVNYNGSRYRAYVYINPSKMRVIKTIYTEDGISFLVSCRRRGAVIAFFSIVVIPFSSEASSFRTVTSLIVVRAGLVFRCFS